jgi:glycosyltransferase involved in cell wall biosynthesis
LHITIRLDYGGIETWLVNVLNHYDREKFQMDVCLIGRRGQPGVLASQVNIAGSNLFMLPFRSPYKFIQQFRQLASNYQIVLAHTDIFVSPFVLFSAYLAGVRHRLIMLHNTEVPIPIIKRGNGRHEFLLHFSKFVFNQINRLFATGILACSVAVLDQNFPGWKTNNSAGLVYLGIDTDRFTVKSQPTKLRNSLEIPDEVSVIGHVGRFFPQKNHHNFVRVARYLSNINPAIHFLLVGDGPLRPEIEEEIRKQDLQNRFHLTGIRDDVPQLMKIMDLAYFPSLHEGFPMTFIEAQVSGLTLVTNNRPEMREAICPQNQPWCIVDADNIKAAGNAILFLLSHSDIRHQVEVTGRVWAIKNFGIERSTRSLEDRLHRCVQSL